MIYVGVSPWCEEPIVSKTGHDGFAYVEKWLRVSQMSEMIIQSEMMFETVYQRVNDRCYWEDYISSELLCLRSMWHFFQTISSEDPKGGTLPDHTYPRCSSIFLHRVIQRISRLSLATFCPMRWWSWLSSWTTQPGPSIFFPAGLDLAMHCRRSHWSYFPWFRQLATAWSVCNVMLFWWSNETWPEHLAWSLFWSARAMNCVGLAKVWESNAKIRDRLRDERRLLTHPPEDSFCKPTRPNCTSNADVLKPVLKRLGEDNKHRLPHIEAFKAEVETLHEKCGMTSMAEKGIYKCTMELKQLAGFVKRRSNRKEVTKEWGWGWANNVARRSQV